MEQGKATTVCIIDDDSSVRKALQRLIRAAGHRVEAFPSATAYLEAAPPTPPACLVLDIRMPGLSGLELQQRLQGTPSKFPIVFITGHGDDDVRTQAMASGAVEVLDKPLDEKVLLSAIERALDRTRLQ
jgi:two-component system response regulator FixJ